MSKEMDAMVAAVWKEVIDMSAYGGTMLQEYVKSLKSSCLIDAETALDRIVQEAAQEAVRDALTVKPLVWRMSPHEGRKHGKCVGRIHDGEAPTAVITRVDAGWSYGLEIYFSADIGLDEALTNAKAAAQDFHTRRILSALKGGPHD